MIKLYENIDINSLEFLGKGTQGSVYKIDNTRCIKIFKKKQSCSDELHSLLISQIDCHYPQIYSYGDNYIVREFIDGITLNNYLKTEPLSESMCNKIVELYHSMRYVGFNRLDCSLIHIFLVDNKDLKLIDTSKAMKKKYSYPTIMIESLNLLAYKYKFLDYVKSNYPLLYSDWAKHIKNNIFINV